MAQQFESLVVAAVAKAVWMKRDRHGNDRNVPVRRRHVFDRQSQRPGEGGSEGRAEIAACAVFQAKDGLFHRATVSHGGGCTDQRERLAGAVCTGAVLQRHCTAHAGLVNRIDGWVAFGAENVGRTGDVGTEPRRH